MPKGGPLAFLNKKHWHPGRYQNQEKVWLKEQEAAKEQQKVDALKKQLEEERAKEELNALAAAAGVKVREEKLDWMYQGGLGAKTSADVKNTLNEEKEDGVGHGDDARRGERGEDGVARLYDGQDPSSANELWQRLHGDPLMIMKQQELKARRSIVSNPVKMDAIKKSVSDRKHERRRRDDSGDDDEYRRNDRRHRHRRHGREEKKSHRRSDGEDDERRRRMRRESPSRDRSHRHGHRRDEEDGRTTRIPSESRYGISFSASAPEAVIHKDRTAVVQENQARLEEAARRKEQEKREEESRVRARKREHRPGRLTEEEKRKRLEEMTQSARTYDSIRAGRVSEYDKKAQAEEEEVYRRRHNKH